MNRHKRLRQMLEFGNTKKEFIKLFIIHMLPAWLLISGPILTSYILDQLFPNNRTKLIILCSFIYILLAIIRGFDMFWKNKQRNLLLTKTEQNIQNTLLTNILQTTVGKIEEHSIGELIELSTNEVEQASLLFPWHYVGAYAIRLKGFLYTVIILLCIDYQLAFIVIVLFLISHLLLIPIYRKNDKMAKQIQQMRVQLSFKTNEFVNSYATNKTLRIEEINLQEIDQMLSDFRKVTLKFQIYIYFHKGLFSLLSFFSLLAVIYIGGMNIASGIASISIVILFKKYIDDMATKFGSFLDSFPPISSSYHSFDNILNLIDLTKEYNKGSQILSSVNTISFEHVQFSYDQKNIILHDINLQINQPMKIALVGKSGSGKSTMVNLIPRFYELKNGYIKINGIDYREYDLTSLRKNIGYVFQEPVLFHMSIYENICYGNSKNITYEEVVSVCKQIGLHKRITQLEQGYDTYLDSSSDKLSYGEKQLLNFAREILKDTDILILDEVSSNLDLEFEKNVMKATEQILQNKIAFIIAHRLKTIQEADLIIYIDHGVIIEQGTHSELVSKKGEYFRLYQDMLEHR